MEWLNTILSSGILNRLADASRLEDFLDDLRTSLLAGQAVMEHADWWRFNPKYHFLNELCSKLHNAVCDAEDLIAQLNYQELKMKAEAADSNPAGRLGQTSLNLFGNFIANSANRITEVQKKIDARAKEVRDVLIIRGLDDRKKEEERRLVSKQSNSSLPVEPVVFGREDELEKVMELILQPSEALAGVEGFNVMSDIPESSNRRRKRSGRVGTRVLPIVGIGGVGKTTLAREVFNDPRITEHFDDKVWVCVSDIFDKEYLTQNILKKVGVHESSAGDFDSMHRKLLQEVQANRLFLILDDLWNEDENEWKSFFAPFQHARDRSVILVTTRLTTVANIVSEMQPFILEGLSHEHLWGLFRDCVFGSQTRLPQQESLEEIGKAILPKLCGSPLAAKAIGRLLRNNFDLRHWENVRESELWELQHEGAIIPALGLSYQYLPKHLKRCFSFCSMFLKDSRFGEDYLESLWIAEGYVEARNEKLLKDVATQYLLELVDKNFFHRECSGYNDELHFEFYSYSMHDLMHDLAHLVSFGDCAVIFKLVENYREFHSVRHITLAFDRCSSLDFSKFPKLRSLCFKDCWNHSSDKWLDGLTNLRMLRISCKECKEIPDGIGELKLLTYLDIRNTCVQGLPKSFWELYNLQYFFYPSDSFEIPQRITRLINLRVCQYGELRDAFDFGSFPFFGRMTSLESLQKFDVGEEGHTIKELANMNSICGELCISNLNKVAGAEEADGARIELKGRLVSLGLKWNSTEAICAQHAAVLEGLRPHRNLKELDICSYGSDRLSPSWFNPQGLPALACFCIFQCHHLTRISICPGTYSLKTLWILECRQLTTFAGLLSSGNFPMLKKLFIVGCPIVTELPSDGFEGFTCLEELEIRNCDRLQYPAGKVLPPSLREVTLAKFAGFGSSFLYSLLNLTSLRKLTLEGCNSITSLDLHGIGVLTHLEINSCEKLHSVGGLQSLRHLSYLIIENCACLQSIGGLQAITCIKSIPYVIIRGNPLLLEIAQPLRKGF